MRPVSRTPRLRTAAALAAALLAGAALAAAATSPAPPKAPAVDEGIYAVSVDGRKLGTENFAFRVLGDSLCLVAQTLMVVDDPNGRRDSVDKRVFMSVGKDDHLLHTFQSNERFHGEDLVRAVVVVPNDTVFSVFREFEGHGTGDRRVLPPGRMFVMDSRLFSLIDFITLTVHEQSFDRRPIALFTLGDQDTLVEATLARVGRDTLRSAGHATPTTRMRLSQGPVAFELWVDARGRMLRLEHPPSGLRVERLAPVKSGGAPKSGAKPAAKPASPAPAPKSAGH